MRKTIAQLCAEYEQAHPEEVEKEFSFYAGAWAMFALLTDLQGNEEESAQEVQFIYEELLRWGAQHRLPD